MSFDYNVISKYTSQARLKKYEEVCHKDPQRTLKLYQTNLRLSQAFYPVLSIFEIILRNALNTELISYFSDPDWLKSQQSGFMNDKSLTFFDKRLKKYIRNNYLKKNVANVLQKHGSMTPQDKIVAELNFGFWVALFDPSHYKVLTGKPVAIFTKIPSGISRSNIYQRISHIRDFRNRIYHNEPIIFVRDKCGAVNFSLKECKSVYKEINDLFNWFDLDFHCWTKRINNIALEIQRASCMMKYYPKPLYYVIRIFLGCIHYQNKYIISKIK